MRQQTDCWVNLLQCRRALCLAVASLCFWPSLAAAQESRPVPQSLSVFRAGLMSAVIAEKETRPATPLFFSRAPASKVTRARSLEDSAVDLITTIIRLSETESYKENPAAGLRLSHTTAGLKFDLPVVPQSRLDFVANVGVGSTRLRSLEFGESPVGQHHRVSETFLSLVGGLNVQYAVTDHCRLFVGARHQLYFNDTDNLAVDEVPEPGRLLDMSSWTFPVTFGLQLSFK